MKLKYTALFVFCVVGLAVNGAWSQSIETSAENSLAPQQPATTAPAVSNPTAAQVGATPPAAVPAAPSAQPAAPAEQPSRPEVSSGIDVRGTIPSSATNAGGGAGAAPTNSAADTASSAAQSVDPNLAMPPSSSRVNDVNAETASAAEATAAEVNNLMRTVPPSVWTSLQEIDYRQIQGIRWPSPFLAASATREKYKDVWAARDVSQFKEIFNDYCLSYARLYQAELESQWQVPAGMMQFGRVCESLKLVVDKATAQDNYLYEYPNPLVVRKMDQAAYQIYTSPLMALNEKLSNATKMAPEQPVVAAVSHVEEDSSSLFASLGLPEGLVSLVTELLLLLSLGLNFFLLYKALKK